jgi:hypothetical protein
MRPYADPDFLTPDERFRELSCLLAAGVLRLRGRAAQAAHPGQQVCPKQSSESGQSCLEVPGETVLSVHNG